MRIYSEQNNYNLLLAVPLVMIMIMIVIINVINYEAKASSILAVVYGNFKMFN